jgi:hypothetical protein
LQHSQIPLGENIHKEAGPVTDGTYGGFIALMAFGFILSLFICNADKIIREDGTKVILMKNPSWKSEFLGLWETLSNEPWIVLLFPLFASSNTFYTYQGNGFNGLHFNVRTRALNNTLYWFAQIVAAVIFGYALDFWPASRSVRAKGSFLVLTAVTFVTWGGGYAWQKDRVTREEGGLDSYRKADMTDGSFFASSIVLYFFYGFFDAAWQTCIYWWMGALSNSGRKTANIAGFYKGIQSGFAAIMWALDSAHVSYNAIFGVTVSQIPPCKLYGQFLRICSPLTCLCF